MARRLFGIGRDRGVEEAAPSPSPGTRLDSSLRQGIEEVSRGIVVDEGGGASLLKVTILGELIVAHGVERVVEIGVYRGRLMLPLGRLMAQLGRGEVVGIDPYSAAAAVQHDAEVEGLDLVEWPTTVDWDGLHRDVIDGISRWGLEGHARLVRERSEDAAGQFAGSAIDMLHVDGNHDRAAVTADLELFLPYMADGALLVMDDISWPSIRPVFESMVREHKLLFSISEPAGITAWPGDVPNDFAVLQLRKPAPA